MVNYALLTDLDWLTDAGALVDLGFLGVCMVRYSLGQSSFGFLAKLFMALPNLSNSMYVARLRYIQSIHESLECRNPDTLVQHFILTLERWRIPWLGREELSKLREDPFYYYLVARTKYYDQVVNDAIADGVQQIVCVGCGSDTRAYRFEPLLRSRGISVLECDQPEA